MKQTIARNINHRKENDYVKVYGQEMPDASW